ncbi:MAG: hypothetical protein KKH28_12425 [Elusimicrobia bacterium]|nr:hypothetical protein [Elusimicrobiota bacterium]
MSKYALSACLVLLVSAPAFSQEYYNFRDVKPFLDPALQDYVETAYGYRNPVNALKFASDFRDAPTSAQSKKNTNKKSSTGGICSSITNILTSEIGKTKNKTKLGILQGGLKYANEICDSGGTPDLTKITKGLPEKDKIRISQKTNSALFDGMADLPDKDLDVNSNQAVALTGRGGQVLDLKASEPDIAKISPVTDFSLNKPTTLLASAKTAISPQKVSAAMAAGDWTNVDCVCSDGRRLGVMPLMDCTRRCAQAPPPPTPTPTPGPGILDGLLKKVKAIIDKILPEPWKLFAAWVSGTSPKILSFDINHPLTKQLMKSENVENTRKKVMAKLEENCAKCNAGTTGNDAGRTLEKEGWGKAASDLFVFGTNGVFYGNPTEAFLGGYKGTWTAGKIDCAKGSTQVSFSITNVTGTKSLTHFPGFAQDHPTIQDLYNEWRRSGIPPWKNAQGSPVGLVNDNFFGEDGFMRNVTENFNWQENIQFKGNPKCKGK